MGGSEKAGEEADGETSRVPLLWQHLISAIAWQQVTVAVIWLNTFQISSWSYVIFPLQRGQGISPHGYSTHSFSPQQTPHRPPPPSWLSPHPYLHFNGSAAKSLSVLQLMSDINQVQQRYCIWFFFFHKEQMQFSELFFPGTLYEEFSQAETGYFPFWYLRKKKVFFLFQVLGFILASKMQQSSWNYIRINKVLNGWKWKWWSWPLKEKIDIELCFQQTVIVVIKLQSPEHRLDARNKIWLSQRLIFMQIHRNTSTVHCQLKKENALACMC